MICTRKLSSIAMSSINLFTYEISLKPQNMKQAFHLRKIEIMEIEATQKIILLICEVIFSKYFIIYKHKLFIYSP